MAKRVLEDLIEALPKKTRFLTKERVIAAATIAAQLLSVVIAKRPGLAPLQAALTTLLGPAMNSEREATKDATQVLLQIKRLQGKLSTANDEDQKQLHAKIDVLLELLTD